METDAEIVERLGAAGRVFFRQFRQLREVQRQAAIPIFAGQDVLVASATASGKTEAIVAPMLARIQNERDSRPENVRLLVVAPTRALVNDLAVRLGHPLGRMGLSHGRQTGDHRDKAKRPFALITTPESFDSMLVRDGEYSDGKLTGHLLAGVRAVFVDEAHLFDGAARGDQVSWLLGRLRRLRRFAEGEEGGGGELQVCAASATVSNPEALAKRLLSSRAIAVRVAGVREIDVFDSSSKQDWVPLTASRMISSLRERLEIVSSEMLNERVERRLWQSLSSASGERMRKALVFVPTRKLCDTLSAHLAAALPLRRAIRVLAHHGSLDRMRREKAEQLFSSSRDAVLVATTTLEVGVDIGDVDLVALVGAPPGTRSLLQRIGRAGRRIGRTRVLALPRTEIERNAFASLLVSSRDAALEPEHYARRWSVFVQQTASFVAQGRAQGRHADALLELANSVWPETQLGTAKEILEALLKAGYLEEHRGHRLAFGEPWADAFGQNRGKMHANLDAPATGIPVVDSSTGEIVAHVAQQPNTKKGVALGGQVWDARYVNGEVLLESKRTARPHGGFRYAARSAPTGFEYALHVRRGLGFGEKDAPIVQFGEDCIWLHFGGSAYETALVSLFPHLRPTAGLSGLAVEGRPAEDELQEIAKDENRIREAIKSKREAIESALAPGPFHRLLPENCRSRVTASLFGPSQFGSWLASRNVWELCSIDRRRSCVEAALSGNG